MAYENTPKVEEMEEENFTRIDITDLIKREKHNPILEMIRNDTNFKLEVVGKRRPYEYYVLVPDREKARRIFHQDLFRKIDNLKKRKSRLEKDIDDLEAFKGLYGGFLLREKGIE